MLKADEVEIEERKLLPCPFCNCEQVNLEQFNDLWYVECVGCTANGPLSQNFRIATNAWNRRSEFQMSIQGLYHLNTESDDAYGFHDEAYKAPLVFEHGKSYLVAKLEGIESGQDVEIYESRCPARFFELVACEDETRRRFGLSFGSGMEMQKLAFGLAHAIADGMVVLNEEEQE